MKELVSVVIPTYNRVEPLRRAIKSVVCQTYDNLEIIIVDDNKNELIRNSVKEIVEQFNDNRIKLLLNERNMGGALTRNTGICASKGAYVAFLDDDDEYEKTKIEKQMNLFEDKKDCSLALAYCYSKQVVGSKIVRYHHNDMVGGCVLDAMLDCIASTSEWLCKKEALVNVGMFSDVPCKQDSDLIIKLLYAGYSLDRVPEYLLIYHMDEEIRISRTNHTTRIKGEEHLRSLCRDGYNKITKKEQESVEHAFACRIAEHYLAEGRRKDFNDCLKGIIKMPFRRSSISFYKRIIISAFRSR